MGFVSALIVGFILIVLIWLGLWNFIESIINIFVSQENYVLRMVIYLLIFLIAALILLLIIKGLIKDLFTSKNVKNNINLEKEVSDLLNEVESTI